MKRAPTAQIERKTPNVKLESTNLFLKEPLSRRRNRGAPEVPTAYDGANTTAFFSSLGGGEYDPLAETSLSGATTEEEDDDSSQVDPAYDVADGEWARSIKRARIASSMILKTEKLPKLEYEDIPILRRDSETATFSDQWFCCELRTTPAPQRAGLGPLMAADIHKLVTFERGIYGCYTGNGFEQDFHYTLDQQGYQKIRHRALKKKLPVEYVNKGTSKCIDELGFRFYVSNENKFKEEIDSLGLEEIFYDCILHNHKNQNTKMKIAIRGSRGNRGPNLGFTGGQSVELDKVSKMMKPTRVEGSLRYGKSACEMTRLHQLMHTEAAFEKYMDQENFPERLDEFAKSIHKDNVFEQMGYLYLVHDDEDNLSFRDMLEFHADSGTDTFWNFLSCGWKTFFLPAMGR
jgi:hypothetical protein